MPAPLAFALLFIGSFFAPAASFAQAQENSAPDPVMVSAGKAIQEGRAADAEKILTDAIRQSDLNGSSNPRLAGYLEKLASLLNEKGRSSEAVALDQRALEINRSAFGKNDRSVERDLFEIGGMLKSQGKRDEAERALKQALEITGSNPSIPDAEGSMVRLYLSGIYVDENRFAEAEPLLLQVERSCAASEDKNSGPCLAVPNELANLYRDEGQTAEADHVQLATSASPELDSLNAAAEQYFKDRVYEKAEESYRRAIDFLGSNKLSNSTFLLTAEYSSLGRALENLGKNDEAEKAYAKAIELHEEGAVGPNGSAKDPAGHTVFEAIRFDDLLEVCRAQKRLSDAEPVIQHTLELQEKLLGARDPSLAQTLVALADLYQEEGDTDKSKYAEALPLYERALDIRQAALGPDDPRLEDVLTPYADLLEKLHQDDKAAAVQARIEAIEK
jgi:tetratricopeptide (TPR) repeat protein